MTTQHIAVFHCQSCGRLVYQSPKELAPVCCGGPTVCAIADLLRETPETEASREPSGKPSAHRVNDPIPLHFESAPVPAGRPGGRNILRSDR